MTPNERTLDLRPNGMKRVIIGTVIVCLVVAGGLLVMPRNDAPIQEPNALRHVAALKKGMDPGEVARTLSPELSKRFPDTTTVHYQRTPSGRYYSEHALNAEQLLTMYWLEDNKTGHGMKLDEFRVGKGVPHEEDLTYGKLVKVFGHTLNTREVKVSY